MHAHTCAHPVCSAHMHVHGTHMCTCTHVHALALCMCKCTCVHARMHMTHVCARVCTHVCMHWHFACARVCTHDADTCTACGACVCVYTLCVRTTCTHTHAHACTPSAYLEQAREFAVPEVHVLGAAAALLAERVDAGAQGQQGAVDVRALLHPLAAVLGLRGRGWAGGRTVRPPPGRGLRPRRHAPARRVLRLCVHGLHPAAPGLVP